MPSRYPLQQFAWLSRPQGPRRRWAMLLMLMLALLWQPQQVFRHQLDHHRGDAHIAVERVCVQCLAFAAADHVLPSAPVVFHADDTVAPLQPRPQLRVHRSSAVVYRARGPPLAHPSMS